jgi:hypothetical protein
MEHGRRARRAEPRGAAAARQPLRIAEGYVAAVDEVATGTGDRSTQAPLRDDALRLRGAARPPPGVQAPHGLGFPLGLVGSK